MCPSSHPSLYRYPFSPERPISKTRHSLLGFRLCFDLRLLATLLEHGFEVGVASGRASTVSVVLGWSSIAFGSGGTDAAEAASLEPEPASASATLLTWS
jgi:hypothetical protein